MGGDAGVTVAVPLGARSYEVHLRPGLGGLGPAFAAATGAQRAVMVSDDTVEPLWGDAVERALGVPCARVVFPAGEANKTLTTWSGVVDGLLAAGLTRQTPVVAVGGGVVGDVAGFAAASALRGVPLVQVPTTLLAMVDSSVGGKTGVNHAAGKNLVGAFYQPRLVWAAVETLTTLDDRSRRSGLGEVLKTALLGDPDLLAFVRAHAEALGRGAEAPTLRVIADCVRVKADVVTRDERESGVRATLNLGHTVAHALERCLGYGALHHGEAVGLGLLAEAAFACELGVCEDSLLPGEVRRLLERLGLPAVSPPFVLKDVVAAARLDKKAGEDTVGVPLLVCAGVTTVVRVAHDDLAGLFTELQ